MSHYLTTEEIEVKTAEINRLQENHNYLIDLTFHRDGDGWYAEVPEHTRRENAMVAGADTVIDRMAQGDNTVEVKFRTAESDELGEPLVTMTRFMHHHCYGAEYIVSGAAAIPFPAYLCDVTHNVTGEHPKKIYVYEVNHYNK